MNARTKQIVKVMLLLALAFVTTTGYTSCEIETPGGYVGVHTDATPIVVSNVDVVVVTRGELNIDYTIDGLSCGKTRVESMSFKLYKSGALVAKDSSFGCNTLRGLSVEALSAGNYFLELKGYDDAGQLAYSFSGTVYHNGTNTSVGVELTPF